MNFSNCPCCLLTSLELAIFILISLMKWEVFGKVFFCINQHPKNHCAMCLALHIENVIRCQFDFDTQSYQIKSRIKISIQIKIAFQFQIKLTKYIFGGLLIIWNHCASFCVEKMLHAAHLTLAPRATRVSMSTADWALMWVQPTILAPFRGLSSLAFCLWNRRIKDHFFSDNNKSSSNEQGRKIGKNKQGGKNKWKQGGENISKHE